MLSFLNQFLTTSMPVSESNMAGYLLQSTSQAGRRSVLRPTLPNSPRSESQQAALVRIAGENVPRLGRLASVSRSEQHFAVNRMQINSYS